MREEFGKQILLARAVQHMMLDILGERERRRCDKSMQVPTQVNVEDQECDWAAQEGADPEEREPVCSSSSSSRSTCSESQRRGRAAPAAAE